MTEITIDYNNDKLIINSNGIPTTIAIKHPIWLTFKHMIYEIINAVFTLVGERHVRLIKIDEDTRTTIEEW
jgi:hypothetical protein